MLRTTNSADPQSLPEQLLAVSSITNDLSSLQQTPKDIERNIRSNACFGSFEVNLKTKLINAITIGLSATSNHLTRQRTANKTALEAIAVLVYGVVLAAERDMGNQSAGKKSRSDSSELIHLKITIIELLNNICKSSYLPRIYQNNSELEHLVGAFIKTVHVLIETTENFKASRLVSGSLEVMVNCATFLGYKFGVQTIILQDLNYLEHLSEFNAELVAKIYDQGNDSTIVDNILQHIGAIKYTNEDGTLVKNVSRFLLKLVISNPKLVLKNVTAISDLIDCEAHTIRMSMLEVYAVIITHNLLPENRTDSSRTQALTFLAFIEERLRDNNGFVRAKVLQVLSALVAANALPIMERTRQIELVSGRIMDKTSTVRKRAIQMLGALIRHHPFGVDGGELSLVLFEERLHEIDAQLDKLVPSEVKETLGIHTDDTMSDDILNIPNQELMQTLLMQKRYYSDAVVFVKQIERTFPVLVKLLSSSLKTEVFEVMDFLVDAHIYGLSASQIGVKNMMHLVWEQDLSTEDGTKRSIREHVLLCYRRIYLDVDSRLVGREKTVKIAENLMGMIESSSASDLPSIEEIIVGFLSKDWIPGNVIEQIYQAVTCDANPPKRRIALMLFSMIGKSRSDVILSRIKNIIKIGLGSAGLSDPIVAEYSCIALRQCMQNGIRLGPDNILFGRIVVLVKTVPSSLKWLRVIAEGIRTLYALCDQPSPISSSLITDLARDLNGIVKSAVLVKLLFVVGEIAVNEVLHLQAIEQHYKASKRMAEKKDKNGMEGITSTEEDEFTDVIRFVQENELIYGPDSLLKCFGPLTATICAQNKTYTDPVVQNIAALTLGKLMTVSSRYCDEQMPLFLTLLEKSSSPIVRSNLTIAFADLAQSFGRVIDTNINYLFQRLNDKIVSVRRSALLVLTHLTLTGMIKIKGQVGNIAKCILDPDPQVANLAKLFFHELAGKNPVHGLYNYIPDIISTLIADDNLQEDNFKILSRFVFEYVKKERQMEGLVDKLCQRIRQTNDLRHAQDLAFCLTLVNYTSDRTVRKFIDGLPMYKDKLVDYTIYSYVMEAIQKAIKMVKPDMRSAVEEFKQLVIQAGGDTKLSYDSLPKETQKTKLVRKGRRGKKANDWKTPRDLDNYAEEDVSEELDEKKGILFDNDEVNLSPPKFRDKSKIVRAPKTRHQRQTIVESSDNDDEDDIF